MILYTMYLISASHTEYLMLLSIYPSCIALLPVELVLVIGSITHLCSN
nr:MAG TPA: hypothetical protein [Caudoviricetes sp.]